MDVLPFRRSAGKPAPQNKDWSQQETADFYRAHNLLQQNGVSIGMDRGLTDKGEPWLVFYDLFSQDVFLHIARIDGRCVLVSEPLELNISARDIAELIGQFEHSVRSLIINRSKNDNTVVLHPAARIIMAISAVFLLSKLDGSGAAHARDVDATLSSIDGVKKQEVTIASRAHSVLSRLMETVDSPAAVAVAFSALLTAHWLNNDLLHVNTVQSSESEVASVHTASKAIDQMLMEGNHNEEYFKLLSHKSEQTVEKLNEVVAAEAKSPEVATEHQVVDVKEVKEVVSLDTSGDRQIVQILPIDDAGVIATTPAPTMLGNTADSCVAVSLVRSLLDTEMGHFSGNNNKISAESGTVSAPPKDSEVATNNPLPTHVDTITIAMVDELANVVSFYRETDVSSSKVSFQLRYFMDQFHNFEVEYSNGNVLIEQENLSGLDFNELGIWKNVMSDGSSISVVGLAHVVDDIQLFLA